MANLTPLSCLSSALFSGGRERGRKNGGVGFFLKRVRVIFKIIMRSQFWPQLAPPHWEERFLPGEVFWTCWGEVTPRTLLETMEEVAFFDVLPTCSLDIKQMKYILCELELINVDHPLFLQKLLQAIILPDLKTTKQKQRCQHELRRRRRTNWPSGPIRSLGSC